MVINQKREMTEGEHQRAERIAAAKKLMAPKEPERRIAIMVCKRSTERCTGAACFWAFNGKERSFSQYRDSAIPVKLWGFFHCNGCDSDREQDEGWKEKLGRLKEEGVERIHLGVCICNYCPHMEEICGRLEQVGIAYEKGTH